MSFCSLSEVTHSSQARSLNLQCCPLTIAQSHYALKSIYQKCARLKLKSSFNIKNLVKSNLSCSLRVSFIVEGLVYSSILCITILQLGYCNTIVSCLYSFLLYGSLSGKYCFMYGIELTSDKRCCFPVPSMTPVQNKQANNNKKTNPCFPKIFD